MIHLFQQYYVLQLSKSATFYYLGHPLTPCFILQEVIPLLVSIHLVQVQVFHGCQQEVIQGSAPLIILQELILPLDDLLQVLKFQVLTPLAIIAQHN